MISPPFLSCMAMVLSNDPSEIPAPKEMSVRTCASFGFHTKDRAGTHMRPTESDVRETLLRHVGDQRGIRTGGDGLQACSAAGRHSGGRANGLARGCVFVHALWPHARRVRAQPPRLQALSLNSNLFRASHPIGLPAQPTISFSINQIRCVLGDLTCKVWTPFASDGPENPATEAIQ